MPDRRQESFAVRQEAAELARSRPHPAHKANGDEQRYASASYFMSFTKGLPHNPKTGLLQESQDFAEFRRAIDDAFIDPFSDRVRNGAQYSVIDQGRGYEIQPNPTPASNFRQWEAPTAGVVFELQGPDPQAVTMPPAPPLTVGDRPNPELVLEMAEVYELAVLWDQPLNDFEAGCTNPAIAASLDRLNDLDYLDNQTARPRKVDTSGALDAQTVFRGSSPGVEVGPYLSQFMLLGNRDRNGGGFAAEGKITYGVLQIDQWVPVAKPELDYMLTMKAYVDVQNGLRPEPEAYVREEALKAYRPGKASNKDHCAVPPARPVRRFISTPRDLATYVHYDALYEAYLNACIVLLEMGTPFDPAFDHLSGVGVAAARPETRRKAGGFALYGGPHILNLVTEVSTRALKAVRFQKFNNHIRLRPEALGARMELLRRCGLAASDPNALPPDLVPAALRKDVAPFAA